MDPIPTSELASILVEVSREGTGTKYGFIACFALLLYDNITTLADEVELIWQRKFSAVTFIFFVNRYYSVAVLFIGILESIDPAFTPLICKRMVLFQPLAAGIPLTFFPNFVVSLRVYALYDRNKYLAAMIIVYLLGEFGVALWVYLTPSMYAVPLPGPENVTNSLALHACLAYSSPKLNSFQAATFQFMQTFFDSWVLALVLFKSIKEFMGPRSNRGLRSIIATHGVIYYVVVFSTNVSWALMVLLATTGLKYTMAVPTLVLAPLAANKLTLSLRSYGGGTTNSGLSPLGKPVGAHRHVGRPSLKRRGSWIGTSTFDVHVQDFGPVQYGRSTSASSYSGVYVQDAPYVMDNF